MFEVEWKYPITGERQFFTISAYLSQTGWMIVRDYILLEE